MARRKITTNTAIAAAAEELPDLTAQQQKFVQGILEGKTASDAYRAAYDCSEMLTRTVWAEASRLNANHAVTAWLSAARIAGLGTAVVTFESHIRELDRLKQIAIASGNIGAAVQAEQIRGKAAGHHVDQIRDVTERHDPVQTVYDLAKLTGVDPHIIASQHGVALPDEGATKH